jgi:tetratricopeptide (TPR) repeat protein
MKKKVNSRRQPKLDPAGAGYPPPMRGLLTLGKPKDGMQYAELAEQLKDYVPDLIRMALDPDLNERPQHDRALWAPLHALGVLTELAPEEAVDPLLEMLDWDDDWVGDQLIEFYAAVGSSALPQLQAVARDAQRDDLPRDRAITSLGKMAEKQPDLREEVVRFLTAMLDQPPADTAEEEIVAAWVIIQLLEMKALEALPAVHRAFDEDRVNTAIVAEQDIDLLLEDEPVDENDTETDEEDDEIENEDDGLEHVELEDKPLTLTLMCKACRREREYTFERAYFDVGTLQHPNETQDSPLIIPERVVCPKCGAVDQYDVGTMSQLAILAKIMPFGAGLPDPLPRLEVVDFTTERWGWMPPRQVLPRYESELAATPDDVSLRLGYANTLRKWGYRDRAIDQYEQALLADPTNGDALISIAQMTGEFAPIADALAAWEDVERRFDHFSWPPDERELRREEVATTLGELRAGIRPDYKPKPFLIDDEAGPALAAPVRPPSGPTPLELGNRWSEAPTKPAPSPYGKVGRNEPCPCGSGKKYKQCHGRK